MPRQRFLPSRPRNAAPRNVAALRNVVVAFVLALPAAVAIPAGQASAAASQQASAATGRPVVYNSSAGIAATLASPGSAPPGANDWSCAPSMAHPYPVVLVHGTFGNMTDSWQAGSVLLTDLGYCVFALDYGGAAGSPVQGYGDIRASAAQLAGFVDKVLTATGAAEVDIVGHSQGGLMPRHYLKYLGGSAKVHELVGLAPSNHGTTLNNLTAMLADWPGGSDFVAAVCAACAQQIAGSGFLTELNAGGDTVAGVHYTVIGTKYENVVTPYTSAFLTGSDVTNLTLQNVCRLDYTDHLGILYDHVAWRLVLNALDPAHAEAPVCTVVLPGIGG